MNDFYLVGKNLTRNKLRLCLNVFAIFIAFFLFSILGAIKTAFEADVEVGGSDRLVVVNKINFTQLLPYSYVDKIRNIDNVKNVTWANWFGGYYRDQKEQIFSFAVDPDSWFEVYENLTVSLADLRSWKRNRVGILVGERLANIHGWKIGDRILLGSSIYMKKDGSEGWEFEISGFFKATDKSVDTSYLVMHYDYFAEANRLGVDGVGWLVVTTTSSEFNEQVIFDIDAQFANSPAETKTDTEEAFQKAFMEQLGDIGFILNSVLLAAFFTILLIVGNSMLISIRERTRELAVLKTIGFSSQRVFGMVLCESLLLAFLGGLLGVTFSLVVIDVLESIPQLKQALPILFVTKETIVLAILCMLGLGLASGLVPAYRALKLNTIDALTRG